MFDVCDWIPERDDWCIVFSTDDLEEAKREARWRLIQQRFTDIGPIEISGWIPARHLDDPAKRSLVYVVKDAAIYNPGIARHG